MEKGRRTPRCESGVDRRESTGDGERKKKRYGLARSLKTSGGWMRRIIA